MVANEKHSCIGCGKDTTARCQICDCCTQMRRHRRDNRGSASAGGPLIELHEECEYDYSEDSLGPHVSDGRWNWSFID